MSHDTQPWDDRLGLIRRTSQIGVFRSYSTSADKLALMPGNPHLQKLLVHHRSPTRRLARLNSCSRAATFGSSVRGFRAATLPSRNSSRQLDSTTAGWPASRLKSSRLSPAEAEAAAPPPVYASPTNVSPMISCSWAPPVAFALRPNVCPEYSRGNPSLRFSWKFMGQQ